MVEESTQDLEVPFEAMREGEQEDFEEQEDNDNRNDHENEEEQPTTVLFTLEQLEVLLGGGLSRDNLKHKFYMACNL
jgi:hypothetical protein